MNTLKRVILINSGGYSQIEVPCDGHVQIVGTNGEGKTTLLRAILFFYVGNNDNASYGIHTTQKDMASHYLGNPPSYLIYEVQRSGGAIPFHVAVTRPSSRVQFLFIDNAYDDALYIDPSRVVRSFEEVRGELDSRLINHETRSSYQDFHQIIYGVRKSPYSVFRANQMATQQVEVLPRIISGIFTGDRMDANRLKRALCSGLMESPQSLQIDLRQLRNNLSDFQRINRAVRTYLSNQKTVEKILDRADRYDELYEQLERQIRVFIACAKAVSGKEEELQSQKSEMEAAFSELKAEHSEKQNAYQKDIERINTEIGKLTEKIERGEKREREYQEQQIDEKIAKMETLPVLRQKLEEAEARYQFLTKEYQGESERREDLLSRLKQAKDGAIASLQADKAECEAERNRELEEIEKKTLQKRQKIEEEEQQRISALKPQREKLDTESEAIVQDWKNFHERSEPVSLRKKREEQEHLQSNLGVWEKRKEAILTESRVAQSQSESASKTLDHEREKLEDLLMHEKQELDAERKRIRSELDSMEKSIAGLIQREKPEWLPTATRTLARDFLFHDADSLEARVNPREDSSLFGLNLSIERLEGLKAVVVDPAVLQNQLSENQNARDAFAARAEQQRAEIDGKRDAVNKKRRKQIEAWDTEKHELETSIRKTKNALNDISNSITNIENEMEDNRDAEKKRIEQREKALNQERRELEHYYTLIRNETKQSRDKAQADKDEEKQTIDERTDKRLKQILEQIKGQEKHYKEQFYHIHAQFLKQLEKKGSDPAVINEAEEAVKSAARTVKEVEGYGSMVERYQQYKREEIEPLSGWRSHRETLRGTVEAARKRWEAQSESFKAREVENEERIAKLRQNLDAVSGDMKEIENFRKDPIAVEYIGLFTDDSLEPASDYNPGSLRDLVQSARTMHNRLHRIDEEGDRITRKFLNEFEFFSGEENDLGFAPILDGFKWTYFVGERLRSFNRLNKIQHFRNLQTKQFDSIISQIVREVSRMEDALRQVKATARQVQENLADEKFIDILDSIELRVRDEPSELWNQLKKMERFQNINFSSEFDLFQPQADESSVKEAIQAFENLVKQLERESRETLSLEDSFEFTIRVIENGHDHGFRASLDHIGSTGTDYLVKMLIYLSLIDLIRKQSLIGDDQDYLHCILDETGVLSPKYIKEVISYAEKKRIFLITAGHSATSKGYRYWFRVRKKGKHFGGEKIISKHPTCE